MKQLTVFYRQHANLYVQRNTTCPQVCSATFSDKQ